MGIWTVPGEAGEGGGGFGLIWANGRQGNGNGWIWVCFDWLGLEGWGGGEMVEEVRGGWRVRVGRRSLVVVGKESLRASSGNGIRCFSKEYITVGR